MEKQLLVACRPATCGGSARRSGWVKKRVTASAAPRCSCGSPPRARCRADSAPALPAMGASDRFASASLLLFMRSPSGETYR